MTKLTRKEKVDNFSIKENYKYNVVEVTDQLDHENGWYSTIDGNIFEGPFSTKEETIESSLFDLYYWKQQTNRDDYPQWIWSELMDIHRSLEY